MTDKELLIKWYIALRAMDPIFYELLEMPEEKLFTDESSYEGMLAFKAERALWARAKKYAEEEEEGVE